MGLGNWFRIVLRCSEIRILFMIYIFRTILLRAFSLLTHLFSLLFRIMIPE
jgi:hypothetical protein